MSLAQFCFTSHASVSSSYTSGQMPMANVSSTAPVMKHQAADVHSLYTDIRQIPVQVYPGCEEGTKVVNSHSGTPHVQSRLLACLESSGPQNSSIVPFSLSGDRERAFSRPSSLATTSSHQFFTPDTSAFTHSLPKGNIHESSDHSWRVNGQTSSVPSYDPPTCLPPYSFSSVSRPAVNRTSIVCRRNALRENTDTLKKWLREHIKNPYPTKGEKIMLAIITKMTLTQVSTWFANARRRLKKDNKMIWSPRNRCWHADGDNDDGGGGGDGGDEDRKRDDGGVDVGGDVKGLDEDVVGDVRKEDYLVLEDKSFGEEDEGTGPAQMSTTCAVMTPTQIPERNTAVMTPTQIPERNTAVMTPTQMPEMNTALHLQQQHTTIPLLPFQPTVQQQQHHSKPLPPPQHQLYQVQHEPVPCIWQQREQQQQQQQQQHIQQHLQHHLT